MKLHQAQARFRKSDFLYRGFVGGRGAGKSFVGAYDLLRRVKPNRLYVVTAPTYKVLADSSLRSFLTLARQFGVIKKQNFSTMTFRLGNDAEVLFRSTENPETLRGPNLSGAWMDEASISPEEAYSILIGCLREAGELGWLSATFTPKGKKHWTYRIFGLQANGQSRPNTELFHATTKDNPFNPPDFSKILRSQYTTAMAEQEVGGHFTDAEGGMFHREWFNHKIINAAPAGLQLIRYWDRAATENGGCFTCGLLLGRAADGRYYILHEERGQWSPRTRDEKTVAAAIQDRQLYPTNQPTIYIEREGGSSGVDVMVAAATLLDGFPFAFDSPKDSKTRRAEAFAAQCEAGNVFLVANPSRPWDINDYIDEVCFFPQGYKDRVDATVGAYNLLARPSGYTLRGPLFLYPTPTTPFDRLRENDQIVTVGEHTVVLPDDDHDEWWKR